MLLLSVAFFTTDGRESSQESGIVPFMPELPGLHWNEAADAIATAKEAIIFLDQRISTLSNYFQLSPTVRGIRESAGGILFLTPSKVSHLSRLGEQASADEISELFIDDIHAFCVMISGKDQIRYEATRKSSSSSQMQSFF